MSSRSGLLLLFFGLTLPLAGQFRGHVPYHDVAVSMTVLDNEMPNGELTGLQRSYAMELAYRYQPYSKLGLMVPLRLGNMDVGEFANPGFTTLDLLVRYAPFGTHWVFSPYLTAGYGLARETGRGPYRQLPLALGFDLRLGDNVVLTTRAEYRNAGLRHRDNLNLSFGYVFRFRGGDADGDRIPNGRDRCPGTPGKASAGGCPDADGDGVADKKDRCPDLAGSPTANGCPDSDRDGLPDAEDHCPYAAGKKRLRGCPDLDGDGVPDDLDACPNTPGSLYSGCPDTDGDGFEDPDDDCPDRPGPNRGCPAAPAALTAKLDSLASGLVFSGRAPTLPATGLPYLDEVARVTAAHPDLVLVVATHTDNGGTPLNNERLSERRARAIRDYLLDRGLAPERIRTVAYAATRPLADEATAEGRRQNNRVVFSLVTD